MFQIMVKRMQLIIILMFMYAKNKPTRRSLVMLRKLDVLQDRGQVFCKCFEKYSDTRIILDCTDVFIQSPSSLENKSLTYSCYKLHATFKSLV